MSYGKLTQRPDLHADWPSPVKFTGDEIPPTRPEEYTLALNEVHKHQPITILDAACGWYPPFHILPEILHKITGALVVALDANPENLYNFENIPGIIRMMGDIGGMPFADLSFDSVVCISTLEHLPPTFQSRAVFELCRLARKHIVITLDHEDISPIVAALQHYGFDCGEEIIAEGDLLDPIVSFISATRK